jgi:membrane-associated phospholipid phosphatase
MHEILFLIFRETEMAVDVGPDYKRQLRRTLTALLVCAVLVQLCYTFVDRPVAIFVRDRQFTDHPALKWLTYPPPVLQSWVPAVLAALMVRRAWGPFHRWECTLVAACVGMVLADQFRQTLAFVFGRTWPETWVDDNPSFIRDGAFGFHPFHGGIGFESFPSGHSARTLAVAGVAWIGYPRWRWVCVLAAVLVALGLVGMNYHFVGDVIAGGFVGGIVAMYVAHFCGVDEKLSSEPKPIGNC